MSMLHILSIQIHIYIYIYSYYIMCVSTLYFSDSLCVYECGLHGHFDKPVVYFPKSFQCCNGVAPKAVERVCECEVCCYFSLVLENLLSGWVDDKMPDIFVCRFIMINWHFIVLLYEKTVMPRLQFSCLFSRAMKGAVCFRSAQIQKWERYKGNTHSGLTHTHTNIIN